MLDSHTGILKLKNIDRIDVFVSCDESYMHGYIYIYIYVIIYTHILPDLLVLKVLSSGFLPTMSATVFSAVGRRPWTMWTTPFNAILSGWSMGTQLAVISCKEIK